MRVHAYQVLRCQCEPLHNVDAVRFGGGRGRDQEPRVEAVRHAGVHKPAKWVRRKVVQPLIHLAIDGPRHCVKCTPP